MQQKCVLRTEFLIHSSFALWIMRFDSGSSARFGGNAVICINHCVTLRVRLTQARISCHIWD